MIRNGNDDMGSGQAKTIFLGCLGWLFVIAVVLFLILEIYKSLR